MKVLHTAHSYPPEVSGVSEVLRQMSERLARRGHEVHVATGRPPGTPDLQCINGVHVHRFDAQGNAVTGMSGELRQYVSFVLGQSWDVIGMHCAQTWTTDLLLDKVGLLAGATVFVGHGLSALNSPAYKEYYKSFAQFMRCCSARVALSESLEELGFAAMNDCGRVHIVPNGVDVTEWRKPLPNVRELWAIGARPWVVTVSNHSPVKGHCAFFRVVRGIRRKRPDVLGTIIGGGHYAAALGLGRLGIKGGCWYKCQLASRVTPCVRLESGNARWEVISAIQNADLVLVCSSREASPLVVLESMAAGTPWMSFPVGCIREHVGGIVVNSEEEMVDCALRLIANQRQRQELGRAAQARIAVKHDWEQITDQYEQVYAGVFSLG